MATILATTTLELTKAQKKELFDDLSVAIIKTFKTPSIYFRQIDIDDCSGNYQDQLQVFICVPPYMTVERRRILVKDVEEVKNKWVKVFPNFKLIVTYHYHDDEACGVDGVLRSDAKAAAAANKK